MAFSGDPFALDSSSSKKFNAARFSVTFCVCYFLVNAGNFPVGLVTEEWPPSPSGGGRHRAEVGGLAERGRLPIFPFSIIIIIIIFFLLLLLLFSFVLPP